MIGDPVSRFPAPSTYALAPLTTLVGYPGGAIVLIRSGRNVAHAFIEMRISRSYQRIEPHPPVLTIEAGRANVLDYLGDAPPTNRYTFSSLTTRPILRSDRMGPINEA